MVPTRRRSRGAPAAAAPVSPHHTEVKCAVLERSELVDGCSHYNSTRLPGSDRLDSSPLDFTVRVPSAFVARVNAVAAAKSKTASVVLRELVAVDIVYYDGSAPLIFVEDAAGSPESYRLSHLPPRRIMALDLDANDHTLDLSVERKFPLSSSHGGRRFRLAFTVGDDVVLSGAFAVFAKKAKVGVGCKYVHKPKMLAVDAARMDRLQRVARVAGSTQPVHAAPLPGPGAGAGAGLGTVPATPAGRGRGNKRSAAVRRAGRPSAKRRPPAAAASSDDDVDVDADEAVAAASPAEDSDGEFVPSRAARVVPGGRAARTRATAGATAAARAEQRALETRISRAAKPVTAADRVRHQETDLMLDFLFPKPSAVASGESGCRVVALAQPMTPPLTPPSPLAKTQPFDGTLSADTVVGSCHNQFTSDDPSDLVLDGPDALTDDALLSLFDGDDLVASPKLTAAAPPAAIRAPPSPFAAAAGKLAQAVPSPLTALDVLSPL